MSIQITRQPQEQTFFGITLAVGTTPTPLAPSISIPSMIQTISICNPASNANSVFYGDANVSISPVTGLEIPAGQKDTIVISDVRQLYELQDPELIAAQVAACVTLDGISIPVICWNPSNIYMIATAATNVSVVFFRNVYV